MFFIVDNMSFTKTVIPSLIPSLIPSCRLDVKDLILNCYMYCAIMFTLINTCTAACLLLTVKKIHELSSDQIVCQSTIVQHSNFGYTVCHSSTPVPNLTRKREKWRKSQRFLCTDIMDLFFISHHIYTKGSLDYLTLV